MSESPWIIMAEALERASEPPRGSQLIAEYIRNDAFRTMAKALREME